MFDFLDIGLWHQLFPSIPQFALMCVGVLLAGTIRSFTGFGAGLVLAPVLSMFMAPADMVVVLLLLNFAVSFQTLPGTWKTTDWKLVFSLTLPAMFGVPIGTWLVEWLDPSLIRRMLGVLVAGLAAIMLYGWRYKGQRGPIGDWIVGVSSGVLTSIAGVGGPPLVLYLLNAKDLSPVVLRSFFMMYFTMMQIVTVAYFMYNDLINRAQILYTASFLPVYIVSTVLGTYLFTKALKKSADLIKRISLWFLLLVGFLTLAI